MHLIRLLLLSVMFFHFNSFGQSYTPMHLELGTCWYDVTIAGSSSFSQFMYRSSSIIDDTLIQGHRYYTAKIEVTSNINVSGTDIHYLRNDTMNKKVYSWINNKDSLIYDFSLGLGDTITYVTGIGYRSLVVDTIGILNVYGVNRSFYGHKQLAWDGLPIKLYIEGIGESRGFLRYNTIPYVDTVNPNGNVPVATQNVNCAYNKQPLYGSASFANSCWPVSNIYLEKKGTDLIIYPNPSPGILYLQNEIFSKENSSYNLYNIHGQKVKSGVFRKGAIRQQIEVDHLVSGLYSIEVRASQNLWVGKIIID